MNHDGKQAYYRGVRTCIAWLHQRALEMNDPHARAILNSAAFSLGVHKPDPAWNPPAVLAPEGTEDGRSSCPGIDPEISSLRERVRGLEEAQPVAWRWRYVRSDGAVHWTLTQRRMASSPAALGFCEIIAEPLYLLPLPEGGRGKAAQSQPSGDGGGGLTNDLR